MPPTGPSPSLIADTGTTGHFLSLNAPYVNKTPSKVPLKVALPDGSYMYSTHTAELSLPQIPTAARIAHLFPALGNTSLLSIGQLCDAGVERSRITTREILGSVYKLL